MAEMQIQIGAEVNGAIRGLQQVETQSQRTFQKVAQGSNQAGQAVNNLSRVVQDAPFGFIAISNNLQPLFDDFTKLRGQTGSVGGALKALAGGLTGPAGIGLAFAAVTSLITVFSKELFSSGKAAEKAKTDADKLKDSINGIFGETAKEAASASALVAVLKSETETRDRKLSAIKQLQQIQPEIFKGLKLEGDAVVGLDSAYQNYLTNLQNVIAAKIKQAQLEQAIEKLLKLQGATLTADEKRYKDLANAIGGAYQKQIAGSVAGAQASEKQRKQTEKQKNEIKSLQDEILSLGRSLSELSKGIKVPELKISTKKAKKEVERDLQRLDLKLDIENPIIKALKSPDILTETQQISKLINENIAKNIKPLPLVLNTQIKDQLDAQKKALQGQLEFAQNAANGISNAFGQAFSSILQGENVFKSLGEALKGFVLQLVQATLKALIFRAIVNAIVPGGAAALGATGLGNLLGFRANGGPVTGRSPYIVGERGPELFVPSVSGSIVPNNQLGSFNGRPAFAGAMGGRSIVRGNDILLTYARTQRSQSRVNG